MIPVRMGSQRLKKKNIALLNGKPLMEYAIRAAKEAKIFNKIYLNSENLKLKKYAKKLKINFFRRNSKLSKNNSKTDEVVKNFFDSFKEVETLVWVNTTTPFQTSVDIRKIVTFYFAKKADTLITVENKFAHVNYKNRPLNYSKKTKFKRTQDLSPIQSFVYSLMIWNRKAFLSNYKKNKSGVLSGKTVFYPIKSSSALMIKKKEDLQMANYMIKNKGLTKIKYLKKL